MTVLTVEGDLFLLHCVHYLRQVFRTCITNCLLHGISTTIPRSCPPRSSFLLPASLSNIHIHSSHRLPNPSAGFAYTHLCYPSAVDNSLHSSVQWMTVFIPRESSWYTPIRPWFVANVKIPSTSAKSTGRRRDRCVVSSRTQYAC
jgi:hypothetical protein